MELAKRLKELGAKQESLFWWVDLYVDGRQIDWIVVPESEVKDYKVDEPLSAFTVAELGKMLPLENVYPNIIKTVELNNTWCINLTAHHQDHAGTEADARAKMLVYLIERELILVQ